MTGVARGFFRGLWKIYRVFRAIVLNLIFIFLVLIIFGVLLRAPTAVQVPDGAALVLSPRGMIVEQESVIDPLVSLYGDSLSTGNETLLRDLVSAVEAAREDSAISALVLLLDELQGGGFSKLRDLGEALAAFKEGGKKVYAVADSYTQAQYYLASYADRIFVNSMGAVDLEGFASYTLFYKSALDKLDVNMHVFRVGEYKSAVESYQRDDMSEEARQATRLWLEDLWQQYVDDVSRARGLSPTTIDDYINGLDRRLAAAGGDGARLALETGLVDDVGDRQAVRDSLVEEIGPSAGGATFKRIDHRNYLRLRGTRPAATPLGRSTNNKVAVIVASGTIYDGEQRPGNIGGDTLADLIRQARDDEAARAVVLRIDSGGGSAFASEIIRAELLRLKAAGKPLVVSMGSVAASGGYWIASPADEIWAGPSTLTGSIGIFALYPTFEGTLDGLGIHADGVGTTELAGAFTVGSPLPELAENAIREVLNNGYQRFLNVVAEGRDLAADEVATLADGRVWSGRQALELGLVDRLGGLDDAVKAAAGLAGLGEAFSVEYVEQPLSPAERFLKNLKENLSSLGFTFKTASPPSPLEILRLQLDRAVRELLAFNDPRGLYMQCLECRGFTSP